MQRLSPTILTFSVLAFLGACGSSPDLVVTADDCEAVADPDPAAADTLLSNWELRYADACPAVLPAWLRCESLKGVSDQERADCLLENVERADGCPGEAREAFLDAAANHRLHTFCLDERKARAREAAEAALADTDVPEWRRTQMVNRCARDRDSEEATACARDELAAHRAAAREEQEALARRQEAVAARNAALAAAMSEHADVLPESRLADIHGRCGAGADAATAATCVTGIAALYRAQQEALAGVPDEHRDFTVASCRWKLADRSLEIAEAGCLADEVTAMRPALTYERELRTSCDRDKSWTDRLSCLKRAWPTTERRQAVRVEAVPLLVAGVEPAFAREAIARACSIAYRLEGRHKSAIGALGPDEHPSSLVRQWAGECVAEQAQGYRAVARIAGERSARTLETCAAERSGTWRSTAVCLRSSTHGEQYDLLRSRGIDACTHRGLEACMAAAAEVGRS